MDRAPLPCPRGPLSEAVISGLARDDPRRFCIPASVAVDFLEDHDAQLALACCYELHYRSFEGVDDRMESHPELMRLRSQLETAFTRRLVDEVGPWMSVRARDVTDHLMDVACGGSGPSLSTFMEQRGRIEHMREFCAHRSAYQLKEADPHTWMIPRLQGRAKSAAITIQFDEYGSGDVDAMHSELFSVTMRHLELDDTYGAYLDALPASTLATDNLVSMFGLNRTWTAACVGHLALFEMTSVVPMARYSAALRRLGIGPEARRFYDVHVTADAEHERIARDDLVNGLLEYDPEAGAKIVWGARALAAVEQRMANALLTAWRADRSALLRALPASRVAS
jgi:hypothetical protein